MREYSVGDVITFGKLFVFSDSHVIGTITRVKSKKTVDLDLKFEGIFLRSVTLPVGALGDGK